MLCALRFCKRANRTTSVANSFNASQGAPPPAPPGIWRIGGRRRRELGTASGRSKRKIRGGAGAAAPAMHLVFAVLIQATELPCGCGRRNDHWRSVREFGFAFGDDRRGVF